MNKMLLIVMLLMEFAFVVRSGPVWYDYESIVFNRHFCYQSKLCIGNP